MSDPIDDYRYQNNIADIGKDQAADVKLAFAERFAFSINKLGRNDSYVAKQAGIPRSALTRYRKGESLPEAKYVFALADALKVNPRWLITGEGHRYPAEEIHVDGSGEGQLVSLFRSLDDNGRQHLLKTASLLWNDRISQRMRKHSADDNAASE